MKQITVLQIISDLSDGGVEAMLMDIYRNIDYKTIRFIFVVQSSSRRYVDEIGEYGGKVYQVSPLHSVGMIAYMKNIITLSKLEKVDVVHCHNLTQNPVLLFAAKIAGVKIRISHSHLTNTFSRKAAILLPIIRLTINCLATHRLACGKDAGKFLYGKKSFLVINNAINVDRFVYAEPIDIQAELGLSKDYKILLHVGRLSEQKNHIYLLNIMEKLSEIRKDVVLICCGSGPDINKIKQKISEKSLEKNVLLLGSRTDIPQLMKGADLLLLPSLYEGFPVTLVESQASGLQALVSNTIDRESDFGIDLVEFLPINDHVDKWVNEICKILDKLKRSFEPDYIKEKLEENGYSSLKNSKVLEEIYVKALK